MVSCGLLPGGGSITLGNLTPLLWLLLRIAPGGGSITLLPTQEATTHCDICKKPIEERFYDCKTAAGPWGSLCRSCFTSNGVGLGTGKGQLYELKGKDWVKTSG